MNSAALQPPIWNRQRWLVWMVLIFSVQVALIYSLGIRRGQVAAPAPGKNAIELFTRPVTEAQFSATFLASDPTLFAAANSYGFSGAAWLKIPKRNYDLSAQIETPFWLALNPQQLGNSLSRFVRTNSLAPIPIAENAAPKTFSSPVLEAPDNSRTNSEWRLEGDLAARGLRDAPELQTWAHSEILSNTVAQIAVNQSGTVVVARVLSRSGLPEADRAALTVARQLQFEPGAKAEVTWGKIVFDWFTVPVVTPNSTNENQAVK